VEISADEIRSNLKLELHARSTP
jgi:hypothetical protein